MKIKIIIANFQHKPVGQTSILLNLLRCRLSNFSNPSDDGLITCFPWACLSFRPSVYLCVYHTNNPACLTTRETRRLTAPLVRARGYLQQSKTLIVTPILVNAISEGLVLSIGI